MGGEKIDPLTAAENPSKKTSQKLTNMRTGGTVHTLFFIFLPLFVVFAVLLKFCVFVHMCYFTANVETVLIRNSCRTLGLYGTWYIGTAEVQGPSAEPVGVGIHISRVLPEFCCFAFYINWFVQDSFLLLMFLFATECLLRLCLLKHFSANTPFRECCDLLLVLKLAMGVLVFCYFAVS